MRWKIEIRTVLNNHCLFQTYMRYLPFLGRVIHLLPGEFMVATRIAR